MTFYSKQYHAAYQLEWVKKITERDEAEAAKAESLYCHVGTFEMVSNYKPKDLGEGSRVRVLALIAQNIVQRGIPTLAPAIVEEVFPPEEIGIADIKFSLVNLQKDFHVDTRSSFYQKNYDGTVTKANVNYTEVGFWQQVADDEELAPVAQFMEPQKPLEHVVIHPNTEAKNYTQYTRYCLDASIGEVLQYVSDQRLDFSLELPKLGNGPSCVAIEMDGPTHEDLVQQSKDKMRDDILKELYWQDTIRIKDRGNASQYRDAMMRLSAPLREILVAGGSACDAVSIPIKVAQMAKAVLYLVEQGEVPVFGGESCHFQMEEYTDKRIALYGIQNAYNILWHLSRLLGNDRLRMKMAYVSFPGKEEVYAIYPEGKLPERINRAFKTGISFRMGECLDKRLGQFEPDAQRGHKVWLYAAYGEDSKNVFSMGKPLSYAAVEENEGSLRYFLYDIFRKHDFRPKQMDIVAAALKRTNIIGLLPTGSGKTLTYQLSILLQPGVGMVIAPLVSLMIDQVENLRGYGIDACGTINGTLSGADKRLLMKRLVGKEFLFMYVAPERLQIKSFKDMLGTLNISTLVMDEAHCVSQWGHDFRTAYLRVGETMARHIKDYITMALTGTASCNVITDIKRELAMTKNVSIVTPNDFRRPELHFKVIHQQEDDDLEKRIASGAVETVIKETIALESGQEDMREREDGSLEKFFRQDEHGMFVNSGLVFCPFAKKKNASTETIYSKLSVEYANLVGMYHGQLKPEEKDRSQKDFTQNRKGLLVATKAFGMGIDKPNIRFTVHTTVPDSIESFYQEAGRAGRDRRAAVNVIMAPPKNKDYERITDKEIFDFFIEQSFPPQAAFIQQVMNLMEASYVKADVMKGKLFQDLKDADVTQKEVDVDTDTSGHVVLRILKDRARVSYDVNYGGDGKVTFHPKYQSRGGLVKSLFYSIFEGKVMKSLKKDLESNCKLTPDNMFPAFELEKRDSLESISDILRRIRGSERVDCYIGLDQSFLANWVIEIMRALIQEKKTRTKGNYPLVLKMEQWKKIDAAKSKAEEKKWNYKVEEFYPQYKTICESNKLELKPLAAYKEWANGLKPLWKGAYDGIQDKIIYYMGALGIYTDYERSYSPQYIKISLKPVDVEDIKTNIKKFISSYETSDYVRREVKLDDFDKIKDPVKLVQEALRYVISYSYEKIKNYRLMQSEVMYHCIQANNTKDDRAFTDAIYKYFESKYSDDLLRDIENENLNLPLKWIDKIHKEAIDGEENLLEDLSHLRTSALKVEEARPQAYTPYLLYAYATFMDHNLEIRSGIDAYLRGRERLSNLRSNYRTTIREICNRMLETTDDVYLKEVERVLDSEYKEQGKELAELRRVLDEKMELGNH